MLDPQFYLAGRYYEPVLVASILRASKRHDIWAPGDDSDLHKQVKILASTESSQDLYGELILAAALNQLPRFSDDALSQGHPDMVAFMQAVFAGRAPAA